ncbi:MAG: hypothetical protein LBR32_00830 [Propionibacteriaceae bacterium]|jgi:hypothetical protein|nr:hypothetical protein [Propionibacteriaceae bacterium]
MSKARESGQASTVLIIAVPALVFVAVVVIVMLGDAFQKSVHTGNAADAASLAAAEAWRSRVDDAVANASGKEASEALNILRPVMVPPAASVNNAAVRSQAASFADQNGSSLIEGPSVALRGVGLDFTVKTRNLKAANQTDTKPEASSTARIELESGACWKRGSLGLDYDGGCRTWAELEDLWTADEPPADPSASPSPSPTPTPELRPVLTFRASIKLVEG